MTIPNGVHAPDLVNPHATVALLESTGICVEPGTVALFDELADLVATSGADVAATRFLDAEHDDTLDRWAAFIAAHLYDGDAPETLWRPPWTIASGMRARPLSRLEQAVCRVTIDRWDKRRSAVAAGQYAIAEASATSGELIRIQINGVRIGRLVTVELGGGRDQLPRSPVLDEWATGVVKDRLSMLSGTGRCIPLLYNGSEPASTKAQASASGNLSRVLRIAGFGDDPTLNPTSIRNTHAARMFESGARLETIAEAMGSKSIDKLWRMLKA